MTTGRGMRGMGMAAAIATLSVGYASPVFGQPPQAEPVTGSAGSDTPSADAVEMNRRLLAALEQRRAEIVSRRAEFRDAAHFDYAIDFLDRQIRSVRDQIPASDRN